eukprot:12131854-Alexandrium_andersonii.AAC.1
METDEDGETDAGFVTEDLRQMRYWAKLVEYEVQDWGSRTMRHRLTWIAIDGQMLEDGGDAKASLLVDNILKSLKCEPLPLKYFLENNGDYRREIMRGKNLAPMVGGDEAELISAARKAPRTDPMFKDEHMEIFRNMRLSWPPLVDPTRFESCAALSPRAKEV